MIPCELKSSEIVGRQGKFGYAVKKGFDGMGAIQGVVLVEKEVTLPDGRVSRPILATFLGSFPNEKLLDETAEAHFREHVAVMERVDAYESALGSVAA